MKGAAVVVGNTDRIGLALTRQLLERGFEVTGTSKRASRLVHEAYRHCVVDVSDRQYRERLAEILPRDRLRLCVHCAGIGEDFSLDKMALDVATIEVNLVGLVRTAEVVVPCLAAGGGGVFAGLSSLADLFPVSARGIKSRYDVLLGGPRWNRRQEPRRSRQCTPGLCRYQDAKGEVEALDG